ncbi:PKD domain-containing protein [Cytophagaceae bacterium ABcell3]|nr:PKD domain-containing protein [Cytophagaceae bacterium ABcell3]
MLIFFSSQLHGQLLSEEQADTTLYKVIHMPFNSTASDFCAVPYRDGIIFCSARKSVNSVSFFSDGSGHQMSNLFYTENTYANRWTKPRLFSRIFFSRFNEGPVCFDENYSTMFFTANLNPASVGKERKKDAYSLKIFRARMVNNEWVNIQSLPFNSDKYSNGHPSLSADGTKLFFASDMPGGYGGSDIYVSVYKEGSWSKPMNLGPDVNTSGDELFPYITHDGSLYFASDGHKGLGGLDVYSASFVNDKWTNVSNLGKPVNSDADDFGFLIEKNGITGYFSSNRNGSADNIYRFERSSPKCDTVQNVDFCFTFFEKSSLEESSLPLAYEWSLGDGNKKRGAEINHCYEKSGSYTIQLNIIDSITGKVFFNEATYEISIDPIRKPYFELVGGKVVDNTAIFDASRSSLPHCIIDEYLWDFGDGFTSLGKQVKHRYSSPGVYEVYLNISGVSDISGGECSSCVTKKIKVPANDSLMVDSLAMQASGQLSSVHHASESDSLIYKVQLTSSETPIPLDSERFCGIDQPVSEYYDRGQYGYTVGEETELLAAYPLYVDIKEKGFEDAQVVAFSNGKLVSGNDTSNTSQSQEPTSVTYLSGRTINRFGEPLPATVYLEDLTYGKKIAVFSTDSSEGRFEIMLMNNRLYGFYAEYPDHYSVSNHIDLRDESRSLEIKKNIELVAIEHMADDNFSLRINNLFFDSNSSKVSSESYAELDRLAKMIKKHNNVKVEIAGHTDNINTHDYNLKLSQKRAEAVKDYLVSIGVGKNQITAKGYGFTRPLVSNSTERGRYLNRRVEFRFVFD